MCRREGRQAHNCPEAWLVMAGTKRGHSPANAGERHATFWRRAYHGHWRATMKDTVLARSVSTGRSPSVPRCCAPSPSVIRPASDMHSCVDAGSTITIDGPLRA